MVGLVIVLIIVAIVVILGLFVLFTYNALVKLGVRVDEAWSDITVQLKRRADLIPNLVSTVQGYATHEREVFENVTKARSAILSANGVSETAKAENQFEGALKSLFAVSENYPELKANENFKELQQELVDTEDKIQASRRFYNAGVGELNTKIKLFPNTLFARQLGFKERVFFEVDNPASIAEPVAVKF